MTPSRGEKNCDFCDVTLACDDSRLFRNTPSGSQSWETFNMAGTALCTIHGWLLCGGSCHWEEGSSPWHSWGARRDSEHGIIFNGIISWILVQKETNPPEIWKYIASKHFNEGEVKEAWKEMAKLKEKLKEIEPRLCLVQKGSRNKTDLRVMREYRSQRIPTTNRGQKVVKLVDTSELISISILGQPR